MAACRPILILLLSLPSLALAQDEETPLKLKLSSELTMQKLAKDDSSRALPWIMDADRVQTLDGRYIEATGNVAIRSLRDHVEADWLRYDKQEDEVKALGHVSLSRDEDSLSGSDLQLKITDRIGVMNNLSYEIARINGRKGRGQANALKFEGRDRYSLQDSTYTTCPAGQDDWLFRAKELNLDYEKNIGSARQVKLEYLGTPILYAPWVDFSLDNHRKSGLLTPSYGASDKRGLELSTPWYWNIAPNRDATITPRIMTRRGLQVTGEYRYLEPAYNGSLQLELLPRDSDSGELRYHTLVSHQQQLSPRLSGQILLEEVSDDSYFSDLSSQISDTSRVNLPRDLSLFYNGGWWNAQGRLQSYQTLQDPNLITPAAVPYQRLPQILLTGSRTDLPFGAKFELNGEFVRFEHSESNKAEGSRLFLYPSLSMPKESSYGYLNPKLGWHYSQYDLDRNPDSPSVLSDTRSLPIFSVEGGLVMEREWSWLGQAYTQTLEPRAYYVYIPYKDQSGLPVFDSGPADLSLTRLFSENQFVGVDRINDANQLTMAVTSRILEPLSGLERLRVTLGQRFYFEDQRVTLPGVVASGSNVTDLLALVSGQITEDWRLDSGLQYNPDDDALVRASLGATYQLGPGRRVNMDLRYINEDYSAGINQLDVSWQWPIKPKWYSLGRVNYSFLDNTLVEGLLGLEYNAGCWMVRGVAQRLVTATGETSNAFYLQLELSGLTSLGPNPLDVLKRNITGYQKSDEIDQTE